MSSNITEKTFRQIINDISDQYYPMTGAVIAAMATQAAALSEACMQISLDNQVDKLDWQEVTGQIGQMAHIKETLLVWCDQHTNQMSEHMPKVNHSLEPKSRQLLCDHLAEISSLSIQAAKILQDFRPLAFEKINDDLEMGLNLLTMTAKNALLLLENNLQRWSDKAMLAEYEPVRARLREMLKQLTP
jgi:formiminotetrahydrofolate cyclodeaminase